MLAFVLALVTLRLPTDFWQHHSIAMLIASIVTPLAVLMTGNSMGGASCWIVLGPLRIQPTEFTRLSLFYYIADCLVCKADEVCNNPCEFLKSTGVIFALVILLLT